jgi:hypothetical protein
MAQSCDYSREEGTQYIRLIRFIMRIILIGSLVCIALSGCGTKYKNVSNELPSAELVLTKDYADGVGFGTASMQSYTAYENGDCAKPVLAANFTLFSKDTKTLRIAAGEPFQFLGAMADIVGGSKTTTYRCTVLSKFTPVAGRTYAATMIGGGTACAMTVIDKTTGETVEGLETKAPDFEGDRCKKPKS